MRCSSATDCSADTDFEPTATPTDRWRAILDVDVVSLELVDPRFYHLDTCFCPLDATNVLVATEAFAPASMRSIRELVPNVIEVPVEVAAGFACNAMPLGSHVLASLTIAQMEVPLRAAGYTAIPLPMGEFLKAGGGVRCLSLPLGNGDTRGFGHASERSA